MFGLARSAFYGDFDGYGGDFDGYGPDRGNWSDKSQAAIRRENQAHVLVDAFFEKCKTVEVFPVTEVVVPPKVHLTNACWKSFKEYVISRGCTTKRREATCQERVESGDKRSGKLYVISVTVSVHPSKAEEEKLAQKKKAKEAAEKRQLEQERKAAIEKELCERTKREYQAVVDSLDNKTASVFKEQDMNQESDKPSPNKKQKTITVPKSRFLAHADCMHQNRLQEIHTLISREKTAEQSKMWLELEQRMEAKKVKLQTEAKEYMSSIKAAIESSKSH
jgi:hypothetical protein|mmetsp:Transcript_18077/g.32782  ORF Transcript_18077/g.32782 Transcript_18077/m.32782 type:complete len:278 (-) Transcript_18077:318-1151(-)